MSASRESSSADGAWPTAATLVAATRAHALEVREVADGLDVVEEPVSGTSLVADSASRATGRASTAPEASRRERLATAFDSPRMLLIRSWRAPRPLEPDRAAAPLVAFPRTWCTRHGRSCRMPSPGAGSHAVFRARPTFF